MNCSNIQVKQLRKINITHCNTIIMFLLNNCSNKMFLESNCNSCSVLSFMLWRFQKINLLSQQLYNHAHVRLGSFVSVISWEKVTCFYMFHCSPCWIFSLIFLYLLTFCHNTFSQLHIWNKTISLLFKIKQLKLALDLIELVHDTEPLHFYCKKPTLGAEALMFILYADPLSFSRPRSRGRLFFPKIYSKCSKIGGKLKFTCFLFKSVNIWM